MPYIFHSLVIWVIQDVSMLNLMIMFYGFQTVSHTFSQSASHRSNLCYILAYIFTIKICTFNSKNYRILSLFVSFDTIFKVIISRLCKWKNNCCLIWKTFFLFLSIRLSVCLLFVWYQYIVYLSFYLFVSFYFSPMDTTVCPCYKQGWGSGSGSYL